MVTVLEERNTLVVGGCVEDIEPERRGSGHDVGGSGGCCEPNEREGEVVKVEEEVEEVVVRI